MFSSILVVNLSECINMLLLIPIFVILAAVLSIPRIILIVFFELHHGLV